MGKVCFFVSFSKMKTVPPEPFLMKGDMSHGDVSDVHSAHEVSLSFGVTTDLNLWPLPPETDTPSQHPLPTHPHGTDSMSGLAAVPVPAPDGDQKRKKKAERKCLVDQPPWETLVQEVVSADQSLARVLYPIVNRKTAVMLMEQMLSEDNLLMEDHYKKKQEEQVPTPEQTPPR